MTIYINKKAIAAKIPNLVAILGLCVSQLIIPRATHPNATTKKILAKAFKTLFKLNNINIAAITIIPHCHNVNLRYFLFKNSGIYIPPISLGYIGKIGGKMKKIFIIILVFLMIFSISKKKDIPKNNSKGNIIYMTLSSTSDVVELEMEEYLKGVLLAEMPASFSLEALKAQAVAARTYTFKKLSSGNHICDNPSHCQAWCDPTNSNNYEKISQAITETSLETLTYLGEPIEAFFHSSSGGKTESSENVWSSSRPYLIAVDSPGEDKIMNNFYSTKEITYKELQEKINTYKNKKIITSSKLKNKIKIISKTDGNRVKEIKIENTILSGTEIRSIFNLRSANFEIELKADSIVFKVSGYGHGVGMSQWGAEVMARNGSSYKDILYHYYPGTLIKKGL